MLMRTQSHWALNCLSFLIGIKKKHEPLITSLCRACELPAERRNIPEHVRMADDLVKDINFTCYKWLPASANEHCVFIKAVQIKVKNAFMFWPCFFFFYVQKSNRVWNVLRKRKHTKELLSFVGVTAQVQQVENVKRKETERWVGRMKRFLSSPAVLKLFLFGNSLTGQLMKTDARTRQCLWLFR